MVSTRLLILTLALVLLPAVPSEAAVPLGHPGPHPGAVVEGATMTHVYSSDVLGNPCIPMIAQFIVTLLHVPTTDTLRLEARGEVAESVGGEAVVSFYASWCTTFTIEVTGVEVEDLAVYEVTVERIGGA